VSSVMFLLLISSQEGHLCWFVKWKTSK